MPRLNQVASWVSAPPRAHLVPTYSDCCGEDFRLTLEACESFSIPGHRCGQDFDGDAPFQVSVGCLVDFTHSARADFGSDLIGGDAGASSEGYGKWLRL
jgi:hypothetical protein